MNRKQREALRHYGFCPICNSVNFRLEKEVTDIKRDENENITEMSIKVYKCITCGFRLRISKKLQRES